MKGKPILGRLTPDQVKEILEVADKIRRLSEFFQPIVRHCHVVPNPGRTRRH